MNNIHELLTLKESRIAVTDSHILLKEKNGDVQRRIEIDSINSITVSKTINPTAIAIICASALLIYLAFGVFGSGLFFWAFVILGGICLLAGLFLIF